MKEGPAWDRILDRVLLIALVGQIGFIMYMNLFRADTIIDFDSSSAYMHEMEMGSQGRLFPAFYSYQASLDLDGAAVISAFWYHFTGDIFLSRGIANNLMVILYILVVRRILSGLALSDRWRRFCLLLFFIPYSMTILGYWRTLFTGGGFFALRALVPLLILSLLSDLDKKKALREYALRGLFTLFVVFLTGFSSGPYVLMCAVLPLLLWELLAAFFKGDLSLLKSERTGLGLLAALFFLAGIALQKALNFSTAADSKVILTSKEWTEAVFAAFAGIFELFGGLTVHEDVRLFSFEALGTAVNFAVTCLLIAAVIYTVKTCIRKREISNMKGYIFSVMAVNVMMFSFLDLRYGDTVFESRYHLIPMLPSFFLLALMMEELEDKGLKRHQVRGLQTALVALFLASLLFGDAQWVYAKTALGSEKLKELNGIIEGLGVKTAFVVGEDSKDQGRKLRVYGNDTHYIVLNDGAESAFRTTWGGTTRYLDNSMQEGKTAIIATSKSYETLPDYLISGMEYLRDFEDLGIYTGSESRFDCLGGPVSGMDQVTDFPYSPGYSFENAKLTDEGSLLMLKGGGCLKGSYPGVLGTWDYTVFYEMPDGGEPALIELKAGDGEPLCIYPDPGENTAVLKGAVMTGGEEVSFKFSGSEGTKIKRIEISRN